MRPGTVVYVTPYYPPHVGGLEAVAESIAQRTAEHRDVVVLTSSEGDSAVGRHPRTGSAGSLVVRRLGCIRLLRVPVMPLLLWHAWRAARAGGLLHVHTPIAFCPEVTWLAATLARRPYVAHFHLDADATSRWGWPHRFYTRRVLAFVLRRAARVIAVSVDQPAVLAARYRVDPARVQLVPNGVDPAFRNDAVRTFPNRRPFRFLFVGRLAAQKNVSLLVRAAARMRSGAEVVVVGDGGGRLRLEALAHDLGPDRVRFVGRRTAAQLVEEYARADAFVLCSRKESTGLVLLEAMSAGLPVIATDVDGSRDTVGEDGVLVALDPDRLARAMDALATDESLWRDLAARSAARAKQHDWADSIAALDRLYAELAGTAVAA